MRCITRGRLLRQKLLKLRAGVGSRLYDAGPAHLIGLVEVLLGRRASEGDRLDARFRLALGLLGVDLLPLDVARLERHALALEEGALRGAKLLPGIEVHRQRDFGIVEAGVHAVLGLFLPAEVEDAVDRPAVAVYHATI